MALKYTLVDVMPKSDSGESTQNSEPSVTVDPLDPNQLIVGAFGASGSSYFKSTDGGLTWSDYGSLVSNDKSLAWKTDGSAALTVSMDGFASPNTFSTYSGTTAGSNFGAAINVFSGSDLDQPWIRTGPSNHVYVAYNDLSKAGPSEGGSGNGGTASVLVSTNGGNTYTPVTLDRVGDPFQDGPSVRLAVNGNTVYGVFVRWNSLVENDANGERYNSQVVVVRSDNGGADGFTALGSGGNGVQVATTTDVFTQTGAIKLGIGKNRTAGTAIAVDPNNANHLLVAYQNAPGANGAGVVQLVLAESNDGGATWSTKFTTSSSVRSGQAAISVLADGAIGFLYDSFDPTTNQLSQHFLTTTNDFATTNDTTLATESNASPSVQFQPYLGDFFDLTSLGNTFYGTFCASNADNGTGAQFGNLTLQRDFTGTMGTGSFQLTDGNGNAVAASIDPYFFSCTLQPPTVAGLSNASYAAFSSPVTLSAGLSLADASSTTLNSATVQITGGTFAGDGDALAADTQGTAITASYNSASEMLTLTGADTLADYQAVLDSVAFSSNSADPTNSGNDKTRTAAWRVDDGSFSSAPQNTTITLSTSTTPPSNPPPPAGTTAVMIMSQPATGNYEIYDLGQNTVLAAHHLTQIGSPWQVAGLGNFSGADTSDMLLRNSSTGSFAIVDVSSNSASSPIPLGNVGLDWTVAGFGDFSSHPDETDMLMRDSSNGNFELYDISNNTVPSATALGNVGPDWQVLGFGDFSGKANETDMLMHNSNTGVVELYELSNNAVTSATALGNIGPEWQFAGAGDFSSRPGETDLLMRDSNNGDFEIYDFQNGKIISATALGNVGLNWTVAGFADFSGHANETDMLLRDSNTGNFELYDLSNNTVTSATPLGDVGLDWHVAGIAPYQSAVAIMAASGNSNPDSAATGGFQGAFDLSGGPAAPTPPSPADSVIAAQFGDTGAQVFAQASSFTAPMNTLLPAGPAAEVAPTTLAGSNAAPMLSAGLLHQA